MMISPETYRKDHENDTYEELLKERNELISEIRYFEKHEKEIMKDAAYICPSPDLVYQIELDYLSELCCLISTKYNELQNME